MENSNVCIGDHSLHICVKGSTITKYSQLEAIRELVRNPRFICGNCGRVAASAKNLCNPEPLK